MRPSIQSHASSRKVHPIQNGMNNDELRGNDLTADEDDCIERGPPDADTDDADVNQ